MSRLDAGLAVALAVLAFAAGSAVSPLWSGAPWARGGPAMADAADVRRLANAQQRADAVRSFREALKSRLADEQVDQVADRAAADHASEPEAAKLQDGIKTREALLSALRVQADDAVTDQSAADRELRLATEKANKSEKKATGRLRILGDLTRAAVAAMVWLVFAIFLLAGVGVVRLFMRRRARLIHVWTVVGCSFVLLAALLLAVTAGWIAATAFVAIVVVGWLLVAGRRVA
ncbi:hypothetical protein SAMN04489716_2550 [Actinoplanes derwentensis]|uniref:Uncharacterized protein n=2 Tax=Actinoplanes derwentensis TaxID=113562 RepID=A0A1H1XQD5_9ACTN|nr:hypothetical protein Ade03nite_81450 [Actinoplanes derwentensis]SDT11464.1 hypothetical protein SAMN04489716_2550 [Actinoplanes derwentensis]